MKHAARWIAQLVVAAAVVALVAVSVPAHGSGR
jgi:hypothetical protein